MAARTGTGSPSRIEDGARLAALRDTGLLDQPGEERLERLNRLALELLGVPVSLVSFVAEDRQFFVSQVGMAEPLATERETPLSHSFCRHVVERDAPLVVDDARKHPLVADNLAVRDLDVIAYAGVPVRVAGGEALGAFCAVDATPKQWTERDLAVLADLAAIASDVLEHHRVQAHAGGSDPLTGLPAPAVFRELCDRALAATARRGGTVAIVAADLEGLGLVNEAFGHGGGDELLRSAAMRMGGALRAGDALCRHGADEFLALCDGLDGPAAAAEVAERVRAALTGAPYTIAGKPRAVGAAIGIATAREGMDADELIEAALAALRPEAAAGGAPAPPAAPAAPRDPVAVGRAIRTALPGAQERGEIRAVYQPLVDLATGAIRGVEALARWWHPELGELAPADFIPPAERTGAVVELGEWMLDRACADLARWRAERPADELTLSVNIAAAQLRAPDFPAIVGRILERHGLRPAALCLEITERTLLDERPAHGRGMDELHALGVKLALDGFGTGYSALGVLARHPVDVLCLDRSFVAAGGRDLQAAALVHGVLAFADRLGLTCVAEGIEDATQLEVVRAGGCRLGQGFLFARPVPADAVPGLVAARGT
jgi:diguanylate cyclase (GGDEF)-like protein